MEVKSGATVQSSFFEPLALMAAELQGTDGAAVVDRILVYGGEDPMTRSGTAVIPWHRVPAQEWT